MDRDASIALSLALQRALVQIILLLLTEIRTAETVRYQNNRRFSLSHRDNCDHQGLYGRLTYMPQ